MIRAIIFDLSDVCFNEEESPFIKEFAKKYGLDFIEFEKRYTELLHKAENNVITGKEIWRKILPEYGLNLDVGKIIEEMIDGKIAHQETLDFVKKLRRKYKTAFFTNYNEDYWRLIEKRFDLEEYFDMGLVSYQFGARKPAIRGFEYLLKELAVRPEEAAFTDDKAGNLEEPGKLGIHTIQFKNVTELLRSLRVLGVSVE